MTRTFPGSSIAASALFLAAACSTQYDVGENTGTGGTGGTTAGATGGTDTGTGMGGAIGGNIGAGGQTAVGGNGVVPIETRMINNTPFACTEWGKGVEVGVNELDRIHVIETLGNQLWGLAPGTDARLAPIGIYAESLKTTGDAYCITRHMLGDPRAQKGMSNFLDSWLELKQPKLPDPKIYPEDARLMELNARAINFGVQQILTGNHSIKNLFTGIRPIELSTDWGTATPVNPNERFANGGLLSEAAIIMRSSGDRPDIGVPKIAMDILETFLCQSVPPPPANVGTNVLPPAIPGTSYRDAYLTTTRANPACAGCHKLIDGVGLAMDAFDALGRIQASDRFDMPFGSVDRADLTTPEGVNLSNPVSVANYVANHERVVPCFATAVGNYFLESWNKPNDPEFAWQQYTGANAARLYLDARLNGKIDMTDIVATVVRFMLETLELRWY